ncbi:MAG: hypothetical protein PUD49_00155, partial [Collinsella sp.]|nr:hypothetical protein [Collinsella sp.]
IKSLFEVGQLKKPRPKKTTDTENPPERARCLEARRHRPSGHAAEAERQIAALAGLQRQPVTRFGKTS